MLEKSLIAKVVLWRIVSIATMMITIFLITGNIRKSTSLTIIVQIVQTCAHATFETLWKKYKS